MAFKIQTVVNNQPYLTSIPNNIIITEQGQSDNIRTILEKFKRGQLAEASSRQRSFVAQVAVENEKVDQQQLNELFNLPLFDDYDNFELADLQLQFNNNLQTRKSDHDKQQREKAEQENKQDSDEKEMVV